MGAAVAELRSAGCNEALLCTEARHRRPRPIYERYGWRVDGADRERVFLGHPIREIRFRLGLADEPREDARADEPGATA